MLFNGVYVLWEDPLVLSCFGESDRARFLALKPKSIMLCFPAWNQTWTNIPRIIRDIGTGLRLGKSLHFMSASPSEKRLLRTVRIPGTLVSHNTYVNERVFRPVDVSKDFDAVYAAQMQPFKRLHLAQKVSSLFVVTYGEVKTADGDYDLHRYVPQLRHADYNRRWIGTAEVNTLYNRSRVSLALSACEGAMLSSVEYMLAGLPMVSTPCRGGREMYFDERFVAVVPPTAEGVAAGVSALIRRELDPQVVRAATLQRLNSHRRDLCEYVRKVLRRAGAPVPTLERLYERIFGGESGTKEVFVHSRDFAARGWV
jgi:glycosyltransferase involved in cell wall biosynthesis